MLFIGPCHALLLVKLRNILNVFCCRDLFDFATVATACFTGCLVYMVVIEYTFRSGTEKPSVALFSVFYPIFRLFTHPPP